MFNLMLTNELMPYHFVDTSYHLQQVLVQQNRQSYLDYLITKNKIKHLELLIILCFICLNNVHRKNSNK